MTTVGYSGTALAKKLGVQAGSRVLVEGGPSNYASLMAPLPEGVQFVGRLTARVDVIHLFVTRAAVLKKRLTVLRRAMRSDAALWVSWPKKAARVETDVTEDVIRSVALPLGFVDVKVCAVDEVWSGLKLVVRRGLRGLDAKAAP